jgi:hypothetical protein
MVINECEMEENSVWMLCSRGLEGDAPIGIFSDLEQAKLYALHKSKDSVVGWGR